MTNAYEYIKKSMEATLKSRMIDWRAGETVVKLEKPSDIGRARILGYKDKKGFVVVRVRVVRGGRQRPRPRKGRRSKRMHTRLTLKMSYQWVAEGRAQKKYTNMEVLNSYQVGMDGKHYFYEVIMVDPHKAEIASDKNVSWLAVGTNMNRTFRGLTSAGKKSRGFRQRGPQVKSGSMVRSHARGSR